MGAKFAACMWIYTEEALIGGQTLDREQEEYLKKRTMSIMLCTTWVCAGTFVDHEWMPTRTITLPLNTSAELIPAKKKTVAA